MPRFDVHPDAIRLRSGTRSRADFPATRIKTFRRGRPLSPPSATPASSSAGTTRVRSVRSRRFSRVVARTFVFLLIPLLVGQPILRAYADEIIPPPPSDSAPAAEEGVVSDPPQEAISNQDTITDTATDTSVVSGDDKTTDDTVATDTDTLSESSDSGQLDDNQEQTTEDQGTVLGDATSTDAVVGGDDGTTTPDASETVTGNEGVSGSSDDGISVSFPESISDESVSESSEDPLPTPEEVAADKAEVAARIAEEEKQKKEAEKAALRREVEEEFTAGCVALDGTGYYCMKGDRTDVSAPIPYAAPPATVSVDAKGGDKEIVVEKDGERIFATDNDVDDTFPALDVTGTNVVWQSSVGGHWQIFHADLSTTSPVAQEITNSTESNFNPKTDGHAIVWQAWIEDNWEIVLATPHAGPPMALDALPSENVLLGVDGAWDLKRLTTNSTHDMFPSIAGSIISWQAFDGTTWVIAAYDMTTGKTTYLSDGEKKAERPRFALLWDERGEDGGARVMGWDVGSGERFDATAEAKRVPEGGLPHLPPAPATAPDQAALPISASNISSLQKGDSVPGGGDGDGGNGDDDLSGTNDALTTSATSSDGVLSATSEVDDIASSTPMVVSLGEISSSTPDVISPDKGEADNGAIVTLPSVASASSSVPPSVVSLSVSVSGDPTMP